MQNANKQLSNSTLLSSHDPPAHSHSLREVTSCSFHLKGMWDLAVGQPHVGSDVSSLDRSLLIRALTQTFGWIKTCFMLAHIFHPDDWCGLGMFWNWTVWKCTGRSFFTEAGTSWFPWHKVLPLRKSGQFATKSYRCWCYQLPGCPKCSVVGSQIPGMSRWSWQP